MEQVEVAIIGGGIMGASAAWALGKSGRDALVLERFTPGHNKGSSHGATRIFRFAYDDPYYVSLAQRALLMWRELETVTWSTLLTITGGLDFGSTDYLSDSAAALRTCGAAADILDGHETRNRFPMVDFGHQPSLYSPDTGVLAAASCVESLLEASSLPVRFLTPVESIHVEDDSVILQLAESQIRAQRVIVSAGAWTGPLLGPLGLIPPLEVSREQVLYFASSRPAMPVVIERSDLLRYAVPPLHGAAGVKVGEHGTGVRVPADERDFAIDAEAAARVGEWTSHRFPFVASAEPAEAETCLYTLTPDEDFLLDTYGPVVYASPCSGHGFKFAPIIGEILAALAVGQAPPVDIGRFSAKRFA